VLFMLSDYGERAHRVVYGPMTAGDRIGHWTLMRELGEELHVEDLPADYPAYLAARRRHLLENTAHTPWTDQLYAAYRKDLGPLRMPLLLDLQASLVPEHVAGLLNLRRRAYMDRALRLYRHLPHGLAPRLAPWLLPREYFGQVVALTQPPVRPAGQGPGAANRAPGTLLRHPPH
jgi:hypothetical protein